jgi:hypothetical protein
LSDKQINYIQSLFAKQAELLFRDDSTPELAIVVILALGRFIHMHPPSDLLTDVLQNMTITILSEGQPNIMLCQVVLKCIYDTICFTRIHSSMLV